ncbi:cyclopropane-fatty-acyl-phospholipid synthase [Terrihabitans soli]|uniref:Cyclopropane-fatty-acyl-phospholipid synthase n=1 Tax=Terrihabitans soli TaxID=708113 RepID=A0A6S6QVC5_9HYPH|nr:cyclopropane-fatty-acyl-phospholipid synthase family protein [Terrihabitans soli]BCJ90458.1 cyclopropane-fatty-acyl-phospholipid synthase [Terrihabitans soli]
MSAHNQTAFTLPGTVPSRLTARLLKAVLGRVHCGTIHVHLPSGEPLEVRGDHDGPSASIILRDWRALRRIAMSGDLGFAAGFIEGEWTSPDLPATIEFFARNANALDAAGRSWAARVASQVWHRARSNTRTGSRKNIQFHYDLGNSFYRLWLDGGMQYSSAIYAPGDTLETAQARKLDRILELLDLDGYERVLEIGCGWGAVAERVLDEGCSLTGLTLSNEQADYARTRLNSFGQRADIRLEDYRDVTGRFDRIVSIEMIEAVGEKYWPSYFDVLRERLADGGSAVIQAITINEDRFESYRRNPDFIQRYIFPGGMLPTKTSMRAHAKAAGLDLVHSEAFGLGYANTLADWRQRFHTAREDVEKLGFDRRFLRMWDYYLAYCEGGFRAGTIDVGLYVFKSR